MRFSAWTHHSYYAYITVIHWVILAQSAGKGVKGVLVKCGNMAVIILE